MFCFEKDMGSYPQSTCNNRVGRKACIFLHVQILKSRLAFFWENILKSYLKHVLTKFFTGRKLVVSMTRLQQPSYLAVIWLHWLPVSTPYKNFVWTMNMSKKVFMKLSPNLLSNDGAKLNRLLYLKIMYTAIRKI